MTKPSWLEIVIDSLFFGKSFLMRTIFKVSIEFVTVLLLFYVLVFWPRGMWDQGSNLHPLHWKAKS